MRPLLAFAAGMFVATALQIALPLRSCQRLVASSQVAHESSIQLLGQIELLKVELLHQHAAVQTIDPQTLPRK